jgi:iduronate 2-sulfatase
MPGKHVALIKFSEGGTNLQKQWNPQTRGMLYDQFLAFVRAQLQSITARGDTFTLAGLAWHQGESDASLSSDAYQALLSALIARIRTDLDAPALPVVIGEVYDNHERDAVRAAQRAVAETVPHVFFATSAGLKTSDKGTHFDAASQIELGARMARALLSGKSITTRPSGL